MNYSFLLSLLFFILFLLVAFSVYSVGKDVTPCDRD